MTTTDRDSHLRRVCVELANRHNFVETVVDVYEAGDRRTGLVEDTRRQQRAVRPAQPHVTIHEPEDGGGRDA